MSKQKQIKSRKNKVVFEAIVAYIDYMIANGAKDVRIETDNGFSIATDNVLPREKMESKEFQTLLYNLQKAFAK